MDLIKLTKKEIIEKAKELAKESKEGYFDAIEVISEASKTKLYYETLIAELKGCAMDELYKYNDKEDTTFHGVQFKKTSTAAQYSFKDCEEFKQMDENLKALKKVLTTATKTGNPQIVDGAIYEPVSISKPSTENISLTIK
jgi:hypothetical protein